MGYEMKQACGNLQKVVLIMQARMGSERLPGKVLKPVAGKPLLQYELTRLSRCQFVGETVVATTTNPADDAIVEFCRQHGVLWFRGSEEDVLSRYYEAAVWRSADVVVRVTADCPLIDPALVDDTVKFYLTHRTEYDYVSNVLKRTYPRGMDCEVFSFSALKQAFDEAKDRKEREHVTPFIYGRPERFKLGGVAGAEDQSCLRLTVDTSEDFDLIEKVITALYPAKHDFSLADIVSLLKQRPEWASINQNIKQKA
jgi:spore coat polysaccharide biosynthesis protein SpsF